MRIPATCLVLALVWFSGCGGGGASTSQKAAVLGWVIGQGGIVHLEGQTLEIKKVTDLPSGDLEVAKIDLTKTAVTDADLENVTLLGDLSALTLHGTKITDEGLNHVKSLAKLRDLDLSNTNITDAGLNMLTEMTSLEKLHLHATAVTNEGLAAFHTARPECKLFPAKR